MVARGFTLGNSRVGYFAIDVKLPEHSLYWLKWCNSSKRSIAEDHLCWIVKICVAAAPAFDRNFNSM